MKRISVVIVGIIFFSIANAQPFFGASTAKRGNGAYKGSIYWINWDIDNNSRPGENIPTGTVRTITTPQGITYTITITKLNGNNNNIRSYAPGEWRYDDLKTDYNWYNQAVNTSKQYANNYIFATDPLTNVYDNATDAHNSIIGLANNTVGQIVNFRITVTASLGAVPINILGMVAVGAESIGSQTSGGGTSTNPSESESFTASNTTSQAWQAFDRVQNDFVGASTSIAFTTVADVSNTGKTILMRNPATSGGEGPGEMIWFSKGTNQIDVVLKGGGRQAVAIGFIGTYDFGDAPLSFGSVSHELNVSFSGGVPIVDTGVILSNLILATRNASPFTIGNVVDNDADQFFSANFQGDDVNDLDDEDGVPTPYKSTVYFGESSVDLSVLMKNTSGADGRIWAWVDINKNGIFEANERSSPVLVPNNTNGNINFSITGLAGTFDAFTTYPMRLRLAQAIPADVTGTAIDESSVGVASGGEVEDHLITVLDAPSTGKIFIDMNGNGVMDGTEGLYTGTAMFVYLVDKNGIVVGKAQVVNGTYSIEGIPVLKDISTLNAKLVATSQNLTVGTAFPGSTTAPPGHRKTGEDLTNAGSNITTNGNANDFITLFTGTVPLSGIQNINFGLYPAGLPVVFGNIEAFVTGNMLTVNWQTLKEEDVDHFEIEVSADGTNFKTIHSLKTKAINGDSDITIEYNEAITISNILVGVAPIILLAFCAVFSKKSSKLYMLLIASAIFIGMIGCKKLTEALSQSKSENLFIRIKQVDIDGNFSYSKVIKPIVQ